MSNVLGIDLPGHWRSDRLKNCTTVLNRGSAPDYIEAGPVRAISQAANQQGGLDWSRTRFHAFNGNVRKLRGSLQPHDILINSTGTGTLGRVGYFECGPDGIPCMADGHVTLARMTSEYLHPRFAYYWLSSSPFQGLISAALIVGATNQIELNGERLGNAPVPVPPLEEQWRIADFLDAETARIDSLLSATDKQVSLLSERFQELVRISTVQFQSQDLRSTGIPWMPVVAASWDLHKIGREFVTGSGTTPPTNVRDYYEGGDRMWVTSGDVRDDVIVETTNRVTDAALRDLSALVVHPSGSLVIAMYGAGATKGRVGVLQIPSAVNQACYVLSAAGKILPEFAFYWFRGHKASVVKLAAGAGQPNLSGEIIKDIRIPAPAMPLQKEICDSLRAEEIKLQWSVEVLGRRRALLTERREALITAAVTGQIDVTTARGVNVS